jgi:hypothetical protein
VLVYEILRCKLEDWYILYNTIYKEAQEKMRRRLLVLTLSLVVMTAGMSYGQTPLVHVSEIEGTIEPGGNTFADQATLIYHIHLYNPTGDQQSTNNGFRIYSPDGITDFGGTSGALNLAYCWQPSQGCTPAMFDFGFNIVDQDVDGLNVDTIGFGGVAGFSPGLSAGFDDVGFYVTVGPITAEVGEHLVLDSSYYPPMGVWEWDPYGTDLPWGGAVTLTCDIEDDVAFGQGVGLPTVFDLKQNYPNPFNPATAVCFDVPRQSYVRIAIYNVLGHRVKTLVNEDMAAGSYVRHWDGLSDGGKPVSSGVYLYKMEAGSFIETKKMMMIR